jgi:NDP-sugar pyrophosphorylase family protein
VVIPQERFDAQCLSGVDVLVLGGGLGTRIRQVLGDTPKLLAPILGRPYILYLIDWLRQFGADRVVLSLGHRSSAVIDFLLRETSLPHDMTILPVTEPSPLGTAGALRFARSHLRSDPVLVINGDSFANANLCQFLKFHRHANPKGAILCTIVDDAGRYGRIELDKEGKVLCFKEKDPTFHGSSPINAGIYFLSAALLDEIASGTAASLERDVFGRAPAGTLSAYAGNFDFIDIGTPESLASAEAVFKKYNWSSSR